MTQKELFMTEEKRNMQGVRFIAKIFGVSTRRVEQLKTEGVISGEGKPTKYDLIPTVQAYIRYLSDKANGREKKASDSESESVKLNAEAKLKKAKAEIAELELKELRGELHRAEDVEAIVTDSVMMLRSMLLGLPGKLAVDLADIDSAAEVADRIKKEVHDILNNMSEYEYDAEAYAKRVRERQGWNEWQRSDE